MLILPVILAGGIGARLAPISTPVRPKPFVPLQDGESLLTKTLRRVAGAPFLPPLIIGRAEDRFALLNHARAAGVTPAAILLEENPRNTAAAVALAAWWARQQEVSACLAILPADHLITPDDAWRSSLAQAAIASAQSGTLCLLAATATRAEPGFGHLLLASPSAHHPWQEITRFVEKPDAPDALVAQGARWNMGQFVGSAAQFAEACSATIPATLEAAQVLMGQAERRWEFTELAPWPESVPAISFDRAVLEKIACVGVHYTGHWQDLGTLPAWEGATGLKSQDYAQKPLRTDRPWGYFEAVVTREYEVHKRLILYPDCRLSRQRHQHRTEQWRVLSGTAYVELGDTVQRLEKDQSILIPAGMWHRLGNHHTELLIIEEKQLGKCDETDIERAEDDYGRK